MSTTWTDMTTSAGTRSDERGHQAACYDCGWRGEWTEDLPDAQADAADHRCEETA